MSDRPLDGERSVDPAVPMIAEVVGTTSAFGAVAAALRARTRAQQRWLQTFERFELRFPPELDPQAVAHAVVGVLPPHSRWSGLTAVDVVVVEAVATLDGIRHFIELAPGRVEASR